MRYHFFDHILLTSPAYSYEQYAVEKAGGVIKDPLFQLGLYLASPQLYHILKAKNYDLNSLSVKERSSIMRYYNRMCFRPTPFGSLSSFARTEWGPGKQIMLDGSNPKLHLNLDQGMVVDLAERLTGNDLSKYQFSCNPSLYKSAGRSVLSKQLIPAKQAALYLTWSLMNVMD